MNLRLTSLLSLWFYEQTRGDGSMILLIIRIINPWRRMTGNIIHFCRHIPFHVRRTQTDRHLQASLCVLLLLLVGTLSTPTTTRPVLYWLRKHEEYDIILCGIEIRSSFLIFFSYSPCIWAAAVAKNIKQIRVDAIESREGAEQSKKKKRINVERWYCHIEGDVKRISRTYRSIAQDCWLPTAA